MNQLAPRWVYFGGLLLTVVAGTINVVGLCSVYRNGLTHVTGTLSLLGMGISSGSLVDAAKSFAVVVAFFSGAVVSGVVVRSSNLHDSRRYGMALLMECALLAVALPGLLANAWWGQLLVALAAGLQNALATNLSGAVIRTTHMTGVVTDLGLTIGHALRDGSIDTGKLTLHLSLLGGFVTGSIAGSVGYQAFGSWVLLGPIAATGLSGAGFWWWRQRQQRGTAVGATSQDLPLV